MDDTLDQLRRAYRLIKHDRIEEAQAILRPVLDADPGNVDAWWLLAHATRDPDEIREALSSVLALDPNYSNAPKALEYLYNLKSRPPSPADLDNFELDQTGSDPFAELEEEPFLAEQPLSEADLRLNALEEDAFDFALASEAERESFTTDPFAEVDDAPVPLTLVDDDDPFADLETDDLFAEDEESDHAAIPVNVFETETEELSALFQLEQEALAEEGASESAASEAAAPPARRRRRGWLFALPVLLLVILAVVILAVLLGGGGQAKAADPGPLDVSNAESSDAVNNALAAAQVELQAANLGSEPRAVVAKSKLGDTLFVEFCIQPGPIVVQDVEQAMTIAAHQAATVEGQLPAVGVSINRCQSAQHDTLYRAFVTTADAIRFVGGDFGAGDVGLAAFQARWQTP